MIFSVISIFPELIETIAGYGLLEKAIEKKLITIKSYNLRDFSDNKHRKTDDRPYGGGAGMVMTSGPLYNAITTIKTEMDGRVILLSPYAAKLSQKKVKELSSEKHLILVCGRYEGVDQRIIDSYIDEEISIGDYVIMGGELASGILIESVSRMIDGVVGNRESVETDSFYIEDQFGFPQYTMPRDFKGVKVPEILLSGDHKKILEWRKKNQKVRK